MSAALSIVQDISDQWWSCKCSLVKKSSFVRVKDDDDDGDDDDDDDDDDLVPFPPPRYL